MLDLSYFWWGDTERWDMDEKHLAYGFLVWLMVVSNRVKCLILLIIIQGKG
jgi:hypothetical protein